MDEIDSSYWWGARDLAFLELSELTAMRAPKQVRQRALEIFLAVAESGCLPLRQRISGIAPAHIRSRRGHYDGNRIRSRIRG